MIKKQIMYKYLINKVFSLPRFYKIIIILSLDLLIILLSSYLSLATRLDEFNLFNITDAKYLISIEFFLIPIFVYFVFAAVFKFYDSSFRYYNLGNNFYYLLPVFGIVILFLNILINDYFSYGAVLINFILIFSLIALSRKLISKIYLFYQNKLKINSLVVCSSKNLHKIYQYLKLNQKISIKALLLNDLEKIDFKRYSNYKIADIKYVSEICKQYKIKEIYTDKFYEKFKKKTFKKTTINILQTDDLFKNSEIDIKQQFVDKYFNTSDKIKIKTLNYYYNKTVLITGAGGSIGKNLFFELINSKPKKIILVEQDELKLFNLKKEYENIIFNKTKNIFFSKSNMFISSSM